MMRIVASAWDVASEHFAERFQLFVIIALGESIVITGATTSELALKDGVVAAFVAAFIGSAALWRADFNRAAIEWPGTSRTRCHLQPSACDIYMYLMCWSIAWTSSSTCRWATIW